MTNNLNITRAAFMRRASASDVSATAFKLAYLIAYKYMNSDTGTARPSQDTLARDLNVSVRTVQRLLDILQPLGLIVVPGHGPDRASTYSIKTDKATPMSPINTTPVSRIGGRKQGDIQRQRTRHPAPQKATPMSPQLKKKNQEEEPIAAGATTPAARGESARELTLAVVPGALVPNGSAPKVQWAATLYDVVTAYASQRQRRALKEDRFPELQLIWSVRPWPYTDKHEAADRKAFAIACRTATVDEILAAARAWVATIDQPRHLPKLADWLSNDNWRKQPPPPKPKRNGNKVSLSNIAIEQTRDGGGQS